MSCDAWNPEMNTLDRNCHLKRKMIMSQRKNYHVLKEKIRFLVIFCDLTHNINLEKINIKFYNKLPVLKYLSCKKCTGIWL